jgi:hypothetical protein
MSRKPAKRAREEGIINEFRQWLNQEQSTDYQLAACPDPPDAILRSSRGTSWIEHADVLRNKNEAHELFSMMNRNESPYKHPGLAIDGYDALPDAFISTLQSKLQKESYDGVKNEYGPGILLLCEMDPLFDEWTLNSITENVETYLQAYPAGGRGNFSHVYLRYWHNTLREYTFVKIAGFTTSS